MSHFKEDISDDQKEKLKGIYGNMSKWARIAPGQTVTWQIDPNSPKEIIDRFEKPKVEFTIFDPDWNHEFLWQAPPGIASEIIALLRKGHTFFNITRKGEGNETRYKATLVGEKLD